jgi:cysteine desulfurase/selenocysteine lyase
MNRYYRKYSANVHRGIYRISEVATEAYESVRSKIARFIGAARPEEIVFTRGTTESVNLVAYAWGRISVSKGDEIATTILEHHSNFVPWQQLAAENGAVLKILNVDPSGKLKVNDMHKVITRRTKLLAITATSNVLGTIVPIKEIVAMTKKINPHCLVFVDAAQAVPHMPVSVAEWDADFIAFSAHKMLGPTGVGVLWGKLEILDNLAPFQFGGEMIAEVAIDKTTFKNVPHKFEAGTPHIAGVIGLGAAVDYLSEVGMTHIREYELRITHYALTQLAQISDLTVYGPKVASDRGGVVAFTISGIHAHDVAQVLDERDICVRAGNHCAMPLHTHLGLAATTRASFSLYTTKEEIDALVDGLHEVKKLLL